MFKRRKQRNMLGSLKESLWPGMGWLRAFHYYRHRIFRGGDSTYRITAGLASGIAVSCSPFVGTHIIQSLVLSKILRANWIAALAGTLWGNPWTFPFLFTASYVCGAWIFTLAGLSGTEYMLPSRINMALFLDEPWEFLSYLLAHPLELLFPMTLGSIIVGFVCWLAAYAILYYPVRLAGEAYARRRFVLSGRLKALKRKTPGGDT